MDKEINKDDIPQRRGKKKTKKRIKLSKNKNSKREKPSASTVIKYAVIAALVAVLIFTLYAAIVIIKAPVIHPDSIYESLNESSVIYDDNNKRYGSVYAGDDSNRQNVEYKDISPKMINAIVAIEDKTFWDHHGFNFIRILGAIKEKVFNGGQISGTSTITQQLARNVYLTPERTISRKIKEAYYTICLERKLSKEEIIEAYLNTINLGYGCYGVQAASNAYFNKDAKDLTISEAAALAAMPQSPTTNALVLRYAKGTVDNNDKNILKTDNNWIYYYNGEASKTRRETVIKFMYEQGYITEAKMKEALKVDIRKKIDISSSSSYSSSSYFTDYLVESVIDDLQEEKGMSATEAKQLIYSGGLKIYSTIDSKAQKIVDKQYSDSSNFPGTTGLKTDSNGNIVNNGYINLYAYSNYFNSNGQFKLHSSEYKYQDDGSLLIRKNKRLNFYQTTSDGKDDISIEFKNMYKSSNGIFYTIEGGIIAVPAEYKSMTEAGNLLISADFFNDHPNFFVKSGTDLIIDSSSYTLRQEVRQPQSAIVILDNKTSQIKAMAGGRETQGSLLYNRALNPRQPGSSIKPLSVYSAALQQGADSDGKQSFSYAFERKGNKTSYGTCWTAASYINDAKMYVSGQQWPKNWYNGFRGYMTLRKSVEQSVNVNAVKVFSEVGADYSVSQLKKFGITTVVEDGDTNDMNASALALGGMTHGVSPLEMAGAYAALANLGTYNEPVAYTKITDRDGEVILESESKSTRVLDKGVTWIMRDILRTTVTNGIASAASIGVQPVAGKTGTTTDNFDAWFCGFTPQYTAALWIGNDVNIELTEGSAAAARLWSKIMSKVCSQFEYADFSSAPDNVTRYHGEYFIKGTEQSIKKPADEDEVELEICCETGELATPSCPETKKKTVEAKSKAAAKKGLYYCHEHNSNTEKYPVNPKHSKDSSDKNSQKDNKQNTQDPSVLPEEDDD